MCSYNPDWEFQYLMTTLIYRMIQEELPPLMELISEDILSKKCHINLGPILNIYRVTFVIGIFLNFNFNYKIYIILMHLLSQKQINFCGLDFL
jgi:hypothetical protein